MQTRITGVLAGLKILGWKVKLEHVQAAEKYMNSPEYDAMLDRHFRTKEFQTKMKKFGHGYSGMTDDEISEEGIKRAKRIQKAGLKFIKTKAT